MELIRNTAKVFFYCFPILVRRSSTGFQFRTRELPLLFARDENKKCQTAFNCCFRRALSQLSLSAEGISFQLGSCLAQAFRSRFYIFKLLLGETKKRTSANSAEAWAEVNEKSKTGWWGLRPPSGCTLTSCFVLIFFNLLPHSANFLRHHAARSTSGRKWKQLERALSPRVKSAFHAIQPRNVIATRKAEIDKNEKSISVSCGEGLLPNEKKGWKSSPKPSTAPTRHKKSSESQRWKQIVNRSFCN